MKHNAHQFEFSATTEVFNLAGEVMRAPEPAPAAPTSNNRTPELIFVDHAELRRLRAEYAKYLK